MHETALIHLLMVAVDERLLGSQTTETPSCLKKTKPNALRARSNGGGGRPQSTDRVLPHFEMLLTPFLVF